MRKKRKVGECQKFSGRLSPVAMGLPDIFFLEKKYPAAVAIWEMSINKTPANARKERARRIGYISNFT